VRPADPFGGLTINASPPKPDPRVDPRQRESWLNPTRENHEQRVHAEINRPEWMSSNPGESAHLMQAVLPGETRRIITQRRPEDNLFLGPVPPRGPSTGARPVTSNVPVYNPTLDQVWAGAGAGKRSGGDSDKIEGIKMTLSGSAGTMDDNPWQQMPLRNPGTLATMRDLRRAHDLNRDLSQNESTPQRWVREQQPQESHTLMGMMSSASAPPPPSQREPLTANTKTEGTSGRPEGSSQVVEEKGEKGGDGGGGEGGGGQGEGESEEGRAHAQERQRAARGPSHGQTVVEKGRLESLRQARENENLRLQMSRHTAPNSRQMADMASRVACHSIEALLKKAYRDQELDQLDEESAVNTLCLVLKMGGEFTYAHSARVLEMAMELADEYGITDEKTRRQIKGGAMLKDIGEMGLLFEGEDDEKLNAMADFMSGQDMRRAGILHDIGKIRIPPEILYKPGRLTEDEYNIMKMHPIYGEQIVYPIASLRHLCPTIRGHHERWDGKGYPDMMKGEEIPLPARVIAVADVFDALAAERPYKAGMPIDKVRAILLEGRGSHFDPDLIDAYMRVLDRRYPELARQRRKAGG